MNWKRAAIVACLLLGGWLHHGSQAGGTPVVTAATFSPSTPVSSGGSVGTASCSANCSGITWSITSGNSSGDFAINSSTGAITFTSTGQTDWPGTSSLQTASLTVQASNGAAGSNTITVNGFADGSPNALTGTAPFPSILSGYTARAPWKVAGVDYAVGIPTGTTLVDPATVSCAGGSGCAGCPSGVSCNSTNHEWTVSGANVTLTSWDFSLEGGWQVIPNANNLTITKCNFKIGANANPIINQIGGSGLTLTYSVLDANGLADSLNNGIITLGSYLGQSATVEYNLIKNANQDSIDYGFTNVIKYNVIANTGQSVGGHNDWVQKGNGGSVGATINDIVNFNLIVQQSGTSQGIGFLSCCTTSGSFTLNSFDASFNSIVTANGQPSYAFATQFSGTVSGGNSGGLSGAGSYTYNYIDPTGVNTQVWEVHGTLAGGATLTQNHNINMNTGAACATDSNPTAGGNC